VKILCTGSGTFTGDDLIEGRYYEAIEADSPTERQNRAFHALVQDFWVSGCHSYDAKNFDQFRDFIKRDIGAGFERFRYVEETESGLKWGSCRIKEKIPKNVAVDEKGNQLAAGILKSWSKYSKKERKETIDRLIAIMIQCGINSKKFDEILKGMEDSLYQNSQQQ